MRVCLCLVTDSCTSCKAGIPARGLHDGVTTARTRVRTAVLAVERKRLISHSGWVGFAFKMAMSGQRLDHAIQHALIGARFGDVQARVGLAGR